MTTRTKLALAGAAAALVVAAVALRPWAPRGGPAGAARAGPALRLDPGSSRAYALSFTTVASGAGAASRETAFEGQLAVRVVAGEGGAPALAVQLEPLRVRVDGAPQPAMERRYGVPFVVAIDPRGRLGASLFPQELPQGDRAVLDGMIRTFQVVLPPVPRDAWEETETDAVGTFVASYRRADGPDAVAKAKTRYTSVHPPALFSVRVLASAMRAEVDAGPWLARAEGAERLELSPGAGAPPVLVEARFRLEPAGAPAASAAVWRDDAVKAASAGVDDGAPAPSAWDEAERDALRRRFAAAGVTVATFVARARTSRLPDAAFAHELAAYLRAFPEAAAELPRLLPRAGDTATVLLLNGLELAGTPEAQDALADVAESGKQERADRIRALVALNGVERPTAETLERLERDARGAGTDAGSGVAGTALLTLGALAPRAEGEARQRITQGLSDALAAATEPRRELLLLMALENAGAALPAAALAPHLASPDAGVREVAARLAGSAQGGDPVADLLAALARERSAGVRGEIVAGLIARAPDPRANAAIASALTDGREPAAAVRVRMVAYLARQIAAFPGNREVLRACLPRERDRGVTVAILNALAG